MKITDNFSADYRSALAVAKSHPGSVVRRLQTGAYGVFDKSGVPMSVPPIEIQNQIRPTENSLASEKIVATQSELQAPRVFKKAFPSEIAQLAKLEEFDSLVEQWKEAHYSIDSIVALIQLVGEAPVETYLNATGFGCSAPITQVIENFLLNPTNESIPNLDTLRFLKWVRSLDNEHMTKTVDQIKKTPNASFIFGIDILMGMKDRDELFEGWFDAHQKMDRLWELIKSYGGDAVDRCFARQEEAHLSLPVSEVLGRLNLEFIQSANSLSLESSDFLSNCKAINIDSLKQYLESAKRDHESALECARVLLDIPCIEFFFFDDVQISMCQAVSIVPSKRSNIKHAIETFCCSSDLETDQDNQDWLLRNKDWLEREIKEQAKYLFDSSESAGVRYLDYLESKSIHLSKESEVVILRLFGWTLEQVGERFDVTRERIRQIEARALRKADSKDRFALLVKKRKQILQESLRTKQRDLIYQIIEDHGPLSEEEIQEKLGSERLNFGDLFSKAERARFLPKQRPAAYELWTDEEILNVLRDAATMAFPLTVIDYADLIESNFLDGPSIPTITNRFRSWGIACEKAGVETGKTNRTLGSGQKFNEKDLLDAICQYLREGRKNTYNDYEDWAREHDAPGGQTLRNRLGGSWRMVLQTGLRLTHENARED